MYFLDLYKINFMARMGTISGFTGTRNGVTVYHMYGQRYMRTKSSLSGKRVKESLEFKETMHHAGILATASRIASEVYKGFTEKKKRKYPYRYLTGLAIKMVRNCMAEKKIYQGLNSL
jgi:hypothetical protein